MRTNPCLLALIPAALIAQAPAHIDYMTVQKTEGPKVEDLLKEFKPTEALKTATSLLPETVPAFDSSAPAAAMQCSVSFSGLVRLYLLAGKAAGEAGEWEQVLGFCEKAQAVATTNYEGTKQAAQPILDNWNQALAAAQKFVDENGERIKALQAKPGRNADEEKEYQDLVAKDQVYQTTKDKAAKNEAAKFLKAHLDRYRELDAKALTAAEQQDIKALATAQDNLQKGPATLKAIQGAVDQTKAEADSIPTKIETIKKNLVDEKTEIAKGIAAIKIKGKTVSATSGPKFEEARTKYFDNVLNTKSNYESRPTKVEKLNFLYRLRHNVNGMPIQSKVDEFIGRVKADQDPIPPAPKAAKGKKKGK
jgi:hypothetical protein